MTTPMRCRHRPTSRWPSASDGWSGRMSCRPSSGFRHRSRCHREECRRAALQGRRGSAVGHPGVLCVAKRDRGAWSIPKGEIMEGEDPEKAARREFAEELGVAFDGVLHLLGEKVQPSGKRIIAYAGEGDIDCAAVRSNSFEIEWPPKSGRRRSFPEIDRAEWFSLDEARDKLIKGQLPFLD